MPDILTNLTEIDERIAISKENLRELVDRAGAVDRFVHRRQDFRVLPHAKVIV